MVLTIIYLIALLYNFDWKWYSIVGLNSTVCDSPFAIIFFYDTRSYATKITYFDVDEYLEGYEETALGEHHILKTPFMWEGYEKKFWWNEAEGEKEKIQFTRVEFQ
jgi:hypothetical protein